MHIKILMHNTDISIRYASGRMYGTDVERSKYECNRLLSQIDAFVLLIVMILIKHGATGKKWKSEYQRK